MPLRRRSLGTVALLLAPGLALALLPGPVLGADAGGDSHVVIAVIDTGINPYHAEFRDPARTQDPRAYITGYPEGAQPLHLCLEACPDLRTARARDQAMWDAIAPTGGDDGAWAPLYYIPGTRIVGAVSIGEADDAYIGTRIVDDFGHGTATASLAAGKTLGLCPECLLVIVEGPGDEALAWAAAQPWIDIVANSWGWQLNLGWPPPPFGVDNAATTKAMVEAGQTVLFSAGNGVSMDTIPDLTDLGEYLLPGESTYSSEYTGPDWVVTVGAVDPANGHPIAGTGRPVDVAAAGLDVPAASHRSKTGIELFSGTSAAAPLVAGAFGHALLQARRALGDAAEGPRAGSIVAQGTPPATALAGPLADGALTRAELQRAIFATARPCPLEVLATCEGARQPWPAPGRMWGWTLPTPPLAYPALVGYGTVTADTRDDAAAALLGLAPLPPRPAADTWAASDSVIRQRLWGSWAGASDGPALPGR